MNKELEGLRWKPRWVSHLGCIKGCLDYLGLDVSWGWLYGGTGHAFVLNMHEVVCPSGPTAWHTEMLFKLAPNLGYKVDGVFATKRAPGYVQKQQEAWEFIRGRLDEDIPCYGWELGVPEYYTIHGYDDVGYYYSGPGCDDGAGPKPWREVSDTEIGVLEMYSVEPCPPASDDVVVREALTLALEHAGNPSKWIYPHYRSGLQGFDLWAQALESGAASRFGQGYNGAVWAECRGEAVAFLKEAKERLSGRADDLFDEAIAHYTVVHARLVALSELFPFQHGAEDEKLQSDEGAALVREAAVAEKRGLALLREISEAVGHR